MAKYLDPKADVTFKKVFGEHKNLVISLLNALLPLDEGKKVESTQRRRNATRQRKNYGKQCVALRK